MMPWPPRRARPARGAPTPPAIRLMMIPRAARVRGGAPRWLFRSPRLRGENFAPVKFSHWKMTSGGLRRLRRSRARMQRTEHCLPARNAKSPVSKTTCRQQQPWWPGGSSSADQFYISGTSSRPAERSDVLVFNASSDLDSRLHAIVAPPAQLPDHSHSAAVRDASK